MIRRRPLLAFFVLASTISWSIWSPLWLPYFGISALPVLPFHHALGALGPIVAAFIVSGLETGRAGQADLVRRMWMFHNRVPWIVFAFCAPIAMLAVGLLGAQIAGTQSIPWAAIGKSREFPHFSAIGFLAYNIFTFGYCEETGWRGFALPRLQARHSALVATLQSYGVDLVALDAFGLRARGVQPADPSAYRIYGARVLAPCAGAVAIAVDGLPDMRVPKVDRDHLAGNHVLLRCAEADVLLGHLQPGSVRVRAGAKVDVGEWLGLVGNSGNTGEPHLHVHAQGRGSTEAPLSGDPRPIQFNGRLPVRGNRIQAP